MSDPAVLEAPAAPTSSAPSAKGPASGPSNPEIGELLVKAAAVALTVGVGVAFLRNKKVQEKVEEAKDDVSATVEDVDYKVSLLVFLRGLPIGRACAASLKLSLSS